VSKIVCFGEALIDMLAQPPVDAQAPRAFLQFAGGAPANVAVAAARLGARSHFAGMLGKDMFGDFLLHSFIEAGVATDCIVRTDAAKTALAFVALDARGERSFSFYRPPAADLLFRESDFAAACFEGTGAFHVCSNSMTEPAAAAATLAGMRRAAAAGAVVSLDLNLRPALWPREVDPTPVLWSALLLADLVKLSREELEHLARPLGAEGEQQVRTRLFAGRARLLVVTDGAGELQWFTAEDAGRVPSFSASVRDTTAAGDAFVGGLLVRMGELGALGAGFAAFLGNRAAIEDAIGFGAAVGALAVTRHGAFAAMPNADEVRHLIRNPHALAS